MPVQDWRVLSILDRHDLKAIAAEESTVSGFALPHLSGPALDLAGPSPVSCNATFDRIVPVEIYYKT